MAKILSALAASSFTSTADVVSQLSGYAHSGTNPVVDVNDLAGSLSGKYFNLGSSSSRRITRLLEPSVLPLTASGQREYEVHALLHWADGSGVQDNQHFMLCAPSGSSSNGFAGFTTRLDPETGEENALYARYRAIPSTGGASVDMVIDTGIRIQDDSVLYLAVRGRSQSAAGQPDGVAEFYVNGKLVAKADNIVWYTTVGYDFITGSVGFYSLTGMSGGSINARGFIIFDGWTTPDETPPDYLHVEDLVADSVTGPDYSNVGGADNETALSDLDDNTYLETDVANGVLTAAFGTVPQELQGLPLVALQIRARVARGSANFNDMLVELRDLAGDNPVGAFNYPITVVDPSRETLSRFVDLTGNTRNVDNISISFTNGDN